MLFCSPKDLFQCKFDECIPWSDVCDGIVHCSNKADENCGESMEIKKHKNFFFFFLKICAQMIYIYVGMRLESIVH
jgi:hypothetical protein